MIKLKQIRLVNWYGFNQITVPIGLFTLIAGKNGNGKSVLLDAIKYKTNHSDYVSADEEVKKTQ